MAKNRQGELMRFDNPKHIKCHLVSQSRTVRLVAKVDAEVVVELHSSVHRVAVDDEHHRALNHSYWTFWTPLFFLQYLDVSISFRHLKKSIWQFKFWNVNSPNLAAHIRVELLVPGGEERRGDVQSLSIKTQLEGIQMRAPNTQKKYKSKKTQIHHWTHNLKSTKIQKRTSTQAHKYMSINEYTTAQIHLLPINQYKNTVLGKL